MPKFTWIAAATGHGGSHGTGSGTVEGPEGYTEADAKRDVREHIRTTTSGVGVHPDDIHVDPTD